jgi:hypothetical protein
VQLCCLDDQDDHCLILGDSVVNHGGSLAGLHHSRIEYGSEV